VKKWAEKFNLPLPECNKCGTCCVCASPSVSYKKLLEKAAAGDSFARDFFSVFLPHSSSEFAEKNFPDLVEKIKKSTNHDDIVFYKCRFHSETENCLVYEDRPSLCRDFPGSPFVILGEKCAFKDWVKDCRAKYSELTSELEKLKKYKEEIENYRFEQKALILNLELKNTPEEFKFIRINTKSVLVSPYKSCFF